MVSGLFCFLSFTSSVSLTSFYTEDEPFFSSSLYDYSSNDCHANRKTSSGCPLSSRKSLSAAAQLVTYCVTVLFFCCPFFS